MGEEIAQRHFTAEDYSEFRARLDQETELIGALFEQDGFSHRGDMAGFELEAWLIDKAGNALPRNDAFLKKLANPLVAPELAAFNVELNVSPTALTGRAFTRLHDELDATWNDCCACAQEVGGRLLLIGILPTIGEAELDSRHMSKMVRYQALNDRLLALRDGAPFRLDIEGEDRLSMAHADVMLEAATTSFQIHLQCKPERAVSDFNAALAISAPMVALAANSPYLFGKSLWAETRIPLFEQAVFTGPRYPGRCSFGTGYARESLFEMFEENRILHPILLPAVHDEPPTKFHHARFQNGTIWRWNRPLIGFDFTGVPHLRIEHRVVPAGPSTTDCIANAAMFYGLVRGLVAQSTPIEAQIPFAVAERNFYLAARHGLDAKLRWTRRSPVSVRRLVLDTLLPLAADGLSGAAIPRPEIDHYLGIIAERVKRGLTGSAWQRQWVAQHGNDFNALTRAYLDAQQGGAPVHEWSI